MNNHAKFIANFIAKHGAKCAVTLAFVAVCGFFFGGGACIGDYVAAKWSWDKLEKPKTNAKNEKMVPLAPEDGPQIFVDVKELSNMIREFQNDPANHKPTLPADSAPKTYAETPKPQNKRAGLPPRAGITLRDMQSGLDYTIAVDALLNAAAEYNAQRVRQEYDERRLTPEQQEQLKDYVRKQHEALEEKELRGEENQTPRHNGNSTEA